MSLRVLISYWYAKDRDLDELRASMPCGIEFIADSGAFSAWTSGAVIAPEEYGAWLQRWEGQFAAYFNLDVIGDAEGSWRNLAVLEGMGLAPIPIFHGGEEWAWLRRMADEYAYVGLGGVAKIMPAQRMAWLVKCFDVARGTALHGLGVSDHTTLNALPFYSVDSSTWANGALYGYVRVFDRRERKVRRVVWKDVAMINRWSTLLRRYGWDPETLRKIGDQPLSGEPRGDVLGLAIASVREMEHFGRERHGIVEIPDDGRKTPISSGPGLKLYVAEVTGLADLRNGANSLVRHARNTPGSIAAAALDDFGDPFTIHPRQENPA